MFQARIGLTSSCELGGLGLDTRLTVATGSQLAARRHLGDTKNSSPVSIRAFIVEVL